MKVFQRDDQKLPVLLVFGGFEDAAHVLDLLHPKTPLLLASFDYPFSPPRKFEFPGTLGYGNEARQSLRDTQAGILEMKRKLIERSDVDPNQITIVGASFGSPFAMAAAAEDAGFSHLVIVHGFGDGPGTLGHRLKQVFQPRLGIFSAPTAWLTSRLLWLYLGLENPEVSVSKLRKSQRVLMISAKEDRFIPQESQDSLWKALQASRAQVHRIEMPGDHLQPGSAKLIEEISDLMMSWLGKSIVSK